MEKISDRNERERERERERNIVYLYTCNIYM